MSDYKIWKYVILLFLGWRIALFFIGFISFSTLPHLNFNQILELPNSKADYWINWAHWDGGHFRSIAEHGYSSQETVFFPAYPILIRVFMQLGLNSLWAGMLISNFCLIISLYFLYKLVLLDYTDKIARRTIFAILIFPTSFYFGAVYSESLFLAATTGAFYFARKNKWLLASVLSFIAVSTRLVGIAVTIALITEFLVKDNLRLQLSSFMSTKIRRMFIYTITASILIELMKNLSSSYKIYLLTGLFDRISELFFWWIIFITIANLLEFLIMRIQIHKIFTGDFLYLILSILPILLYMAFQQIAFQNPFSFITNETNWQRQFSLPWQPILTYLKFLLSNFLNGTFPVRTFLDFSFFSFILIIFLYNLKKIRFSYIIFFFIALILPLFSGTLVAIPRYILIIFPTFTLLGLVENELIQKLGILFSILLLGFFCILFIGGYWVT